MVNYRAYEPTDHDACMAIFDSNTPRYFAPGERDVFDEFLNQPKGFYGVLNDADGVLVGCGGVIQNNADPRIAILRWGMVAADRHGQGFGRQLLACRLRYVVGTMLGVESLRLYTTGDVAEFYRRFGFNEAAVVSDYYGPGLARVQMECPIKHLLEALI